MKWKPGEMALKVKRALRLPVEDDVKIKSGFLLLPKTINDETRWLQVARWKRVYMRFHIYYYGDVLRWSNEEWMDLSNDRPEEIVS